LLGLRILRESLHLKILCHGQEAVQILLVNVSFPLVDEVQQMDQLGALDPPEVEKGVLMLVLGQHLLEDRATGGEDEFVSLHLIVFTGQSYIAEVLFVAQGLPLVAHRGTEMVEVETEHFTCHGGDGVDHGLGAKGFIMDWMKWGWSWIGLKAIGLIMDWWTYQI